MRSGVAAFLARPAAEAERRRFLLIAVSTAGTGAFLLAGARVARLRGELESDELGFAPFIAESGLRGGTVAAAVLLTVPLFVLMIQALRVGSLARDRRMAALRLAGATPRDVRTVAAVEAGGAALAGGVLAAWAYALLWLLVGALPPAGLRLLPSPDLVDVAVWAGMTVVLGAAGGVAGAMLQRRVVTDPLGVYRRAPRPATVRAGAVTLGLAAAVITLWFLAGDLGDAAIFVIIAALLLAAISGGPLLVRGSARLLKRRGRAEALLAGYRLQADPRSPGRVAGVLIVCGVALGVETQTLVDFLFTSESLYDLGFYVGGTGLAILVTLVACAIAVATLIVGAVDQLLDARRPLAALAALGVDEQTLARVFTLQFSAAAVPAIVLGVVIGGLFPALLGGLGAWSFMAASIVTAALAGAAVSQISRGAVRLLRSRIREGLDPENLRVA